ISTGLTQLGLQLASIICDMDLQLNLIESGPNCFVRVLVERIQIVADSSTEHHRILGNDGNLLSKIIQPYRTDVDSIDPNSSGWFGKTEQCRNHGTLSCTSSTNNSDLLTTID